MVYPLPCIDDILDSLANQSYYTTLDLASGYWQVQMSHNSKEKTAFTTHHGLFDFQVMPFGLCNAPATFQRLMEAVLSGLARDVCMVYLDDILVVGRTLEEHVFNLSWVLDRLREANLRLKPSKCYIARREVEYLGHIVSHRGITADPKKIEAVQKYPVPADLKSLRSFLGLVSYYRRFIPQFSVIASPLHALTRKEAEFIWTDECQASLERLKTLLTGAPLLSYPDFPQLFFARDRCFN